MPELSYRNGDVSKPLVRKLFQQRRTSITYIVCTIYFSPWCNDMDLESIATFSCFLVAKRFPGLYQKAVLNRALLRNMGVNNILPSHASSAHLSCRLSACATIAKIMHPR